MKQINIARCIYGRDVCNSQQILGVRHKCVTNRALSYLLASARILSWVIRIKSWAIGPDRINYPESRQIVTHRWRSQHIATDRAICLDPDHQDLETWWERSVAICRDDLRSDAMVTVVPAIVLVVENILTAKNFSTINLIAAIDIKIRYDLIRSDTMIPIRLR